MIFQKLTGDYLIAVGHLSLVSDNLIRSQALLSGKATRRMLDKITYTPELLEHNKPLKRLAHIKDSIFIRLVLIVVSLKEYIVLA